jgi:pyruvate formate lyase activating enzyme
VNTNNEYNLTKADATKPVYSITPFTLLDYPHKTACILWFAGCNMKCVYCYNPDIVFGKGKISISEVLNFLNRRKSLLDGVVLSGGECTSHKNIRQLLQEIKKLGFLVKDRYKWK